MPSDATPRDKRKAARRHPASAVFILPIALTILLAGFVRPAWAELTCGTQPQLPADSAARISSDIEGRADLILRKPAAPDMRGLVLAQRHALRETYPNADPVMLDRYLLWVTCRKISSDSTLAPPQQFDTYSDLYRPMSEPIKAPIHPE